MGVFSYAWKMDVAKTHVDEQKEKLYCWLLSIDEIKNEVSDKL